MSHLVPMVSLLVVVLDSLAAESAADSVAVSVVV